MSVRCLAGAPRKEHRTVHESSSMLRTHTTTMQNDLEFLRIRSYKHEIMVAASE